MSYDQFEQDQIRRLTETCAEKDKEIAELRHQIGTDFMAALVIKQEQRLVEARRLIETFGTIATDSMDVYRSAQKWLEGTP